jgi:transketolase
MTIPLSEAPRASTETQRDAPPVATSAVGNALAVGAQEKLARDGIAVRVVSMPCTSVFDRQDAAYRASVLPANLPRVAVEAGVSGFWHKYVGAADDPRAAVVGIDRSGGVLFKHFGFTVEHVAAAVTRVIK